MPALTADDPVLDRVERMRQRANRFNDQGQPARAARLLRDGLALLAASDSGPATAQRAAAAEALLWISLATSESELNGHVAGLITLHNAAGPTARAQDRRLDFLRLSQLGYMTVRAGDLTEGLAHLDTAEALLAHAEPIDVYRFRLNRGTTYLFNGELRAARVDLEAAIDIARSQGWPVEEKKAQHNVGYLEYLAGNLVSALHAMDEVRAAESGISLAVVLLDRSRVLLEAGLHREADQALTEASATFRASRLWKDVGESELARAECALLAGDPDAARRFASRARARFTRRGDDIWARESELLVLRADLARAHPGRDLAARALRLASRFESAGLAPRGRLARLIAAEAALDAGRLELARGVIDQVGRVQPTDPIATRLQVRVVWAKRHALDHDGRALARTVRAGLDDLVRHQSRFGAIDLQTAAAIHGRDLAAIDVDAAIESGRPGTVFAAVERGRAATSRLSPVLPPTDPSVADALAGLRQLSEELRVLQSNPAAKARTVEIGRQMRAIEHRLRSHSWTTPGISDPRAVASFHDVTAVLAARQASMITLTQARGNVHAVVTGDSTTGPTPIGATSALIDMARSIRTALDVAANEHLPREVRSGVVASLTSTLEAFERAFAGVIPSDQSAIVISPIGSLSAVPWSLLPSLRGRAVVVTPSATAWMAATSPRSVGSDDAAATIGAYCGPGLAHGLPEATAVLRAWQRDAVPNVAPTCRDVAAALGNDRVVHLAAHGRHDMENPLFSHLRMTDGPFYAYELETTPVTAEHVVLSACEVGVATIRPGDEPLGLTSVLLRLGVTSVVAGTARIHDRTTMEFMINYHQALAAGADSATALSQAISHPYDFPVPISCFGAPWTPAAGREPAAVVVAPDDIRRT